MDLVLTRKDPSLEEIHERHNAMKKRSDEKPAPRKTAAQTHQKRAVATHPTTSKSTSGQSVASRESQAEHHRTTVVVTEKPKSTAASAAKEITVASSEGSVKSSSPVTVAPKTEKPKASTVVETKASEEENSTQIAKADMTGSGKVVEKELPTESTANGRFRLKNTVDNCAPLHFWEMLGFGNDDLSHHVALRIPISTMIFSVFGVLMSIFHTFTNLSRPRRIRTFVENVAQVVLWTVCGVTLFLIRQDWEAKWAFGTAGSFGPIYPSAWQCAEFTCYVMVIAYLAECYFYDYNYYKLYFEETIGNYTVVERPEYGNSIYTSTVELAEDTAL